MSLGIWQFVEKGKVHYPGRDATMKEITDSIIHHDSLRLADIEWQEDQIRYYMKSHSVMDESFGHVARLHQLITNEKDSLHFTDSVLSVIYSKEFVHFFMDKRFASYYHVTSFHEPVAAPDTIPYYIGDTDPFGVPSGLGVEAIPGMRMRVGEWRNGKYLGERISYYRERIYGIDISRYQHEMGDKKFIINWSDLTITSLGTQKRKNVSGTVNFPVSFVYIKSTEGATLKNKYFAADYLNSRKYGYRTGAYHFFSTKSSGASQARFFCDNTAYRNGDLPPVLDVEPTDSLIEAMGGVKPLFTHIRAWMHYVKACLNVNPILYVNQKFVETYLPAAPDIMRDYDVWIARYSDYKPNVNLVYWQLCQDGTVKGINGPVDINVFNGFENEFRKYK